MSSGAIVIMLVFICVNGCSVIVFKGKYSFLIFLFAQLRGEMHTTIITYFKIILHIVTSKNKRLRTGNVILIYNYHSNPA